jgi:hypothetical protein
MKNMDWAAMGAASSAYAEASRAQDGVNQLWEEIQLLRSDINSQKYERQFQKWAEELIYQFNKTVTAISESPASPVNDYLDLKSFVHLIEENQLDTSLISGLENKAKFDQTLLNGQHLLEELAKSPEMLDYFYQQELAQQKHKQQQAAALKKEAEIAAKEKERRIRFVKEIAVVALILVSIVIIYKLRSEIYETTYLGVTRSLAELGISNTQLKFGTMHYEGNGVPKDYDEALKGVSKN